MQICCPNLPFEYEKDSHAVPEREWEGKETDGI